MKSNTKKCSHTWHDITVHTCHNKNCHHCDEECAANLDNLVICSKCKITAKKVTTITFNILK